MRRYLDRFQFRGSWRDLKHFFGTRQPHQLAFFGLAIALTAATLGAFAIDSHFEPAYHRDITYVEQWPLSRSDKEIIAQQRIDYVVKARRLAAEKRERDANRAGFQKMENALDAWGVR